MSSEANQDAIALVDSLSPRERQLLVMATDGLTDQAIANELGISLGTVGTYWGRIRIKYGPLGRTEIVAKYLRALMERATEELRTNESRLESVLEALPVGVFLADAEGQPVYVNSAYLRITGRDKSALEQEGLLSLVYPEDRAAADVVRALCLSEGRGYVSDQRWVRGDGTVSWVRVHSEAWRHDDAIAGRVGIVEDLTNEREAHHRALNAEERYRLLFALAPEAIVSVDHELKIVDFNTSATRMFGYSVDEILGQDLEMLIPSRFHEEHTGFVRAFGEGTVAAARPMAARTEVRGLRKDGTEFPCEASIVRQLFEGSAHYTAIVRDVSDRVRQVSPKMSLEAIPVPVWVVDLNGSLEDSNQAFRFYVGNVQDNQSTFSLVHDEDRESYKAALRGEAREGLRLRLRHGGQNFRWNALSFRSEAEASVLVIATDVHDLHQSDEELSRIKAILNHA